MDFLRTADRVVLAFPDAFSDSEILSGRDICALFSRRFNRGSLMSDSSFAGERTAAWFLLVAACVTPVSVFCCMRVLGRRPPCKRLSSLRSSVIIDGADDYGG